jgi:serine/threonine-protein kinase
MNVVRSLFRGREEIPPELREVIDRVKAQGHNSSGWTIEVLRILLGPSPDPSHLGRLRGYEITDVIRHGGMGVVLRGHDAARGRWAAVKLPALELVSDPKALRRFLREARTLAPTGSS